MHIAIMNHSNTLPKFEIALLTSIGEPRLDRVIADLTHLVERVQKLPLSRHDPQGRITCTS